MAASPAWTLAKSRSTTATTNMSGSTASMPHSSHASARNVAQVARDDDVRLDVHRECEDVPVVLGDRHRLGEHLGRFGERRPHGTVHSVDAVGDHPPV